jgi:hypothetical protein
VASIILKWKTFGTAKALPRDGRPAKPSKQGRMALDLMVTLTELQSSSVEMGDPSRRKTISAALHHQAFMVEWLDGSHSSVEHGGPLGVCQKAPIGHSDHEKQDSLV